jgi:hypothetical protein
MATRPVRSNIVAGLAGIRSALMSVLDRVASAISDQVSSGMWVDEGVALAWRHPDGAVEADGFPVEHGILDDVGRK